MRGVVGEWTCRDVVTVKLLLLRSESLSTAVYGDTLLDRTVTVTFMETSSTLGSDTRLGHW